MENNIKIEELYLNTSVLDKMDEYKRDIYIKMYQDLYRYFLNPYDMIPLSEKYDFKTLKEIHANLPQNKICEHLLNNLYINNIIVDKRTFLIDNIIN